MKRKNGQSDFRKNFLTKASMRAQQKKAQARYGAADGDLSETPLASLCMGINYIMQELERRGAPIHDFDNKEKIVKQIQIIGGTVYFLAEEEAGDNGQEIQEQEETEKHADI